MCAHHLELPASPSLARAMPRLVLTIATVDPEHQLPRARKHTTPLSARPGLDLTHTRLRRPTAAPSPRRPLAASCCTASLGPHGRTMPPRARTRPHHAADLATSPRRAALLEPGAAVAVAPRPGKPAAARACHHLFRLPSAAPWHATAPPRVVPHVRTLAMSWASSTYTRTHTRPTPPRLSLALLCLGPASARRRRRLETWSPPACSAPRAVSVSDGRNR